MASKIDEKQLTKRHLYSDDIIDIIKNAILNNELTPGERIIETRWAKKLGISQAPVREAIRELTVIGLVESRPYQGAFVKKINRTQIYESYDVRIALETQAMQSIAGNISGEQATELSEIIDEMYAAGTLQNVEKFIDCDRLFHQKILDFNGNALLIKLWEQCKIIQNSRIISVTTKTNLKTLANRHKLLLSALTAKNKTKIANEVSWHFKSLLDDLNSLN